MQPVKKAVIYARQSSGADDYSESVEIQIENCKTLAAKENIRITGIFSDLNTSGKTYPSGAEGIAANDQAFNRWYKQQTGNKKFRPGLGEVLSRLKEVDYIIVDEITRLYRPVTRSYLENFINNALADNEVSVLQVKGGKVDLSKFDQSLVTMLRNAINDEQIANQKKKSMQQLRKRRDAGFFSNGGGKAFGTVYNIHDGSITIQKEYIPVIRFVFDAVERHVPYLEIIGHLNNKYRHLVKKCYYYSNFYHLISNPVYCGYMYNTEGFLIPNKQLVKPCITFSQWARVKEIVNQKKGMPSPVRKNWLPFSGLLFCGNCGSRLVAGTDRGKIYYYCMAGTNYLKDKKCKKARIVVNTCKKNYTGLYHAIRPLLIIPVLQAAEEAKSQANNTVEIAKLKEKACKLQEKRHGLTDMYIKGLMSINELENNLDLIKKEMQILQEKILTRTQSGKSRSTHLQDILSRLTPANINNDTLTNREYETALRLAVKKIIVFENRIIVKTVSGNFTLPRIQYWRRYFPYGELKCEYDAVSGSCYKVTYNTGCTNIFARLGKLQIISRPDQDNTANSCIPEKEQ